MTGGSQLDPMLRTIRELFEGPDTSYTVPVYQRNFGWGAEQIEQLIGDIQDAIQQHEASYFLGNLIVTQRGSTITDFEVIDGQQRLTTLYLLLTFLAQEGSLPYQAHRDRLLYESRPRATEALRRVALGSAQPAGSVLTTDSVHGEDAGIHQGFNVIDQYMNQFITGDARREFADFLRDKVTVVRVGLPRETDVNRYFEIMNTRGQQLHQVDIVKARLMGRLEDNAERACFAWIWDACADMDSYVQMSLTRGDVSRRERIFGPTWSWLAVFDFGELVQIHGSAGDDLAGVSTGAAMTLDGALEKYAEVGPPREGEDEENVRFRSTIEFPTFLLHVLKVKNRDDEEDEGQLDDKRLIRRFTDHLGVEGEQWVRDFAFELLRCRNLFDAYVLKRQFTATNSDDGDWSLQRLMRRSSRARSIPGYIGSFSSPRGEIEEELDSDRSDLLLLESMLRVTYTSPRTMHWITMLLRLLARSGDPAAISESQLADELRDYARRKVKEAFFAGETPGGLNISRIVFTYLDYLLLSRVRMPEFRFSFRNSIEHFYPQHPDEQQSGAVVSPQCLDLLGNLALVSVGVNSKFSNSLPRAKAENYRTTIELQSPKLRIMAETARGQGWSDPQVLAHQNEMVDLLYRDLESRDDGRK